MCELQFGLCLVPPNLHDSLPPRLSFLDRLETLGEVLEIIELVVDDRFNATGGKESGIHA